VTAEQKMASRRQATKKCAEAKREIIQAVKSQPCHDCRRRYPYWVMDLDHVRGVKGFNLGIGANRSIHRLLVELEKCDVVCANCHRMRTQKRKELV